MPIRPENRDRYPADWKQISDRIRFERARRMCECRGECGRDHTADDQGIAWDASRAISEAVSVDELNKVGGELKSRDLGAHRSSLQAAWTARNNELKGAAG